MSEDQTTPQQGEDQTTTEPTQGGTPEVDYQKRYDDLRPQYDRTQSELNALKQQMQTLREDPEAQAAFLAELGYEIPTEDPDPAMDFGELDDPRLAAYEQRLAMIEAQAQQQEAARQQHEFDQMFEAQFSKVSKDRGEPLTEEEKAIVKSHALVNNLSPQDAYDSLAGLYERQMEQWANSKKPAYRVSPTGGEGTQQPNMDDPSERQAWMAQRLSELNAG